MKKILAIFTAVLLISCNSNNGGEKTQEAENVELESIAEKGGELKDQVVKVSGMVSHVCKHGGQKMFLTNTSQDANLLIRVSQSIPEFEVALEGSNVEVTGKLIATVVENTDSDKNDADTHDGKTNQGEAATGEPEECPTEDAMKKDAEQSKIAYHIEATSFREIEAR